MDVPLLATYPAVFGITIALGPSAGIAATGISAAYLLLGPRYTGFGSWPQDVRFMLTAMFVLQSLVFCRRVYSRSRRRTMDLSTLLKQLGAAEERLRVLATSIDHHMICLLDQGGRIVGWYGTCKVTGWTEREMLGMNLSALYPAGPAGEARAAFDLELAMERGWCRSSGERRNSQGAVFQAVTTLIALVYGDGFCVVIRELEEAAAAKELVAA